MKMNRLVRTGPDGQRAVLGTMTWGHQNGAGRRPSPDRNSAGTRDSILIDTAECLRSTLSPRTHPV